MNNKENNIGANTNVHFLEKERSIQINKYWIKDESFKINKYCLRQGWNMITTKSGVSYMISKKGKGLVNPKVGDLITLDYDVRLLDADQTLCYSSKELGSAQFRVEKSFVESGLHEVVTYLREGDSAIVVLPHFHAHGIAGNIDKIPPLSPVLYYLHVLDVNP